MAREAEFLVDGRAAVELLLLVRSTGQARRARGQRPASILPISWMPRALFVVIVL